MWMYQKHRPERDRTSITQLISFLNTYIDFKLKVLDATAQGMDKDSTYLADVAHYQQAFNESAPATILNKTDYQLIMNEYKEALLLFNISEKKIWDTMGDSEEYIHKYYDNHTGIYDDVAYEQVKSEVAADYQKQLECNWVTALRNKYVVTIDQNALIKLIR